MGTRRVIRSDAEAILDNFPLNSKQVFVFKQEFIPDHYIELTYTMDKQFIVSQKTTDIPNLVDSVSKFVVKEELLKLLVSEQLKVHSGGSWYMDFTSYRTGGCDMGCWASSTPNLHTFGCRKYFK